MKEIPIREESDMLFLQPPGYNLFDIESFSKKTLGKHWGMLPMPEFILWNEDRVQIIEAKKSVPCNTRLSKKKLEACKETAKEEGLFVCTRYEQYCNELLRKYTIALICLRPDVLGLMLKDPSNVPGEQVQKAAQLKSLKISDVSKVLLILVLKGVPDSVITQFQADLRNNFIRHIHPWQPNADIIVMNDEMAVKKQLIKAAP